MSKEIKVKGCGCRFRGLGGYIQEIECDHLCDKHKDEFILKLYNNQNAMTGYLKIKNEIDEKLLEYMNGLKDR